MAANSVFHSIPSNPAAYKNAHSAVRPPDGKPVEQIAFLFLRLKDNAVTLDRIRIANGSLKLPEKQRQYQDAIQHELLSGTGLVFHADSIANPLVKRLMKENEAVFVSRVPWTKDIKQVHFRRRRFVLHCFHPFILGGARVGATTAGVAWVGNLKKSLATRCAWLTCGLPSQRHGWAGNAGFPLIGNDSVEVHNLPT